MSFSGSKNKVMIAIIGGGISGLSAAWYLRQQGIPYRVYEARTITGGCIRSGQHNGIVVEYGPNTLYADQFTEDFIAEIGLQNDMIPAAAASQVRYVIKNGRLAALPANPLSLLFGPFFSLYSKWRMCSEPLRRNKPGEEPESIAAFFRRRLGQELVDYAIAPFMAGIYAADPEQTLLQYVMPRLQQWEAQYGSITLGILKNQRNIPRKKSFTLKEGMQQLPQTLAGLTGVQTSTPVQAISRQQSQWRIHTREGDATASHIILALPAQEAARLLAPHFPLYAQALNAVNYAPMTVVHSVWKKQDIGIALNGFGVLHPKVENLQHAGTLWSSSTFPHVAPADTVLLTSFVGGMQYQEAARREIPQLLQILNRELGHLYHITQPPIWQQACHIAEALPQFDRQIVTLNARQPALYEHGISICANWQGGISVPERIKAAKTLVTASEFR